MRHLKMAVKRTKRRIDMKRYKAIHSGIQKQISTYLYIETRRNSTEMQKDIQWNVRLHTERLMEKSGSTPTYTIHRYPDGHAHTEEHRHT